MTAVQLDQHTSPRHSLSAYPVLGLATSKRTFQARADKDAPQCGSAHPYTLALTEKLTKVGVVGTGVSGAGQVNHSASGRLGNSVGRPAAPVAMSEGSRTALLIGCQDPPDVARATHQFSQLI